MRPTARGLVLDLLSALPADTAVPIAALIRAAAVFGIGAGGVRVAVNRLCNRAMLESDERGFYRLGKAAGAVSREVRSWRRLEEQLVDWDGSWVALHAGALPKANRPALRRREYALDLRGFRTLEPGLAIRPNNLVGGVSAERRRLRDLGVEEHAPVFRLSELDELSDADARALWGAQALIAAYEQTVRRLDESAARLPELPHEQAMAESFELGGEAIRQAVLDPLLPEAIVPGRDRHTLLQAIRRYDRTGRRFWRGWTGLEEIKLEGSPADFGGHLPRRTNGAH